ncbi:brisc and brca1-a complex member 2 [Anaeramoeba ignava]|uniref:BRISC and BRCA1-A complex member 2 n=1 Tax=Anaeramoeba ignava TaxID=1746090 RepID=A0A9Q0LXL4_ANAIG|nr:brisc and brca1-a complex member 2 [Anaeramoeba ignava]
MKKKKKKEKTNEKINEKEISVEKNQINELHLHPNSTLFNQHLSSLENCVSQRVLEPTMLIPMIQKISQFNLQSETVQFIPKNFRKASHKSPFATRFTIDVLYCFSNFSWEVLFNGNNVLEAPDVILPINQEMIIDFSKITSYQSWKSENPECLLNLLQEILSLWKIGQKKFFGKLPPRLKFEYETFENNQEVEYFFDSESKQAIFKLKIVNEFFDGNSILFSFREPFALPEIRVYDKKNNQMMNQNLPKWTEETCIAEYVANFIEKATFKNKIMSNSKEFRRVVLDLFVKQFGIPIEYDSNQFFKIGFLLLVKKKTPIIIYIELPSSFPFDKPFIQIQSVSYFRTQGTTFITDLKKFPFSADYEPQEMVDLISSYLRESGINLHNQILESDKKKLEQLKEQEKRYEQLKKEQQQQQQQMEDDQQDNSGGFSSFFFPKAFYRSNQN